MSVDKDSNGESSEPPVERPPAIRERLWALIPSGQHAHYRKAAAFGLRRGIHPETTVADMLEQEGACSYDVIERAFRPAEADTSAADGGSTSGEKLRSDTSDVVETIVAPRATRPPLWPFGSPGYQRTSRPLGEIGSILHYQCEFDGPTASEIEWLALRAISRDPVFVRRDAANVKLLGCDLPPDVLHAVRAAMEFECDCVIADVRRRQAEGDLTAMTWLDPETLIL